MSNCEQVLETTPHKATSKLDEPDMLDTAGEAGMNS